MLSSLQPVLYIQIAPRQLDLRNAKTGAALCEVAEIAIQRQPKFKVLGVGNEARGHAGDSVEIAQPFAHPRSLVSDFTLGEQLLKVLIQRLQGRGFLVLAPVVILHPLGQPEGGFTQVEVRALQEMAHGAGATQVIVWQGRPLEDKEALSRQFPADGQVLV